MKGCAGCTPRIDGRDIVGDAKRRGSFEERVAQARAKRVPPTPGVYVSTKEVRGMRLLVEDVSVLEDSQSDGFFLVSLIDEASADNDNAAGDDLNPEQWFELVDRYGLTREDD